MLRALASCFFASTLGLAAQVQEPRFDPAREAARAPLAPALRTQLNDALQKRDFTRAETILVDEISRNPKSPELLTLLGGIFFIDGKYPNSVVAIKKAEKLAPLDDATRFTLAMGYVVLKRMEWARPELGKLAQRNPKNALYPYWLARLDYDDQKFEAALAKLRVAVELDPAFVKAHDKMGLCLEALGRLEDAIESYKTAVALNRRKSPAWAWPPLNLGALLLKFSRAEEAEPYLREALKYDPGFAQAHYQFGILLEKQSRPEEAIAELRKAAALDAAYAEPYYALGRIYRNLGRDADAHQALARFRDIKKKQKPPPEP